MNYYDIIIIRIIMIKRDEIWGLESSVLGAGAPKITQLHPEDWLKPPKMSSYKYISLI